MDITITITKAQHDCIFSQLRKVQKTERVQTTDKDGVLLFHDEEETNPKMVTQPVFESDGITPILLDDLTVQEWAQAAIDGKANSCLKKEKIAKALAE